MAACFGCSPTRYPVVPIRILDDIVEELDDDFIRSVQEVTHAIDTFIQHIPTSFSAEEIEAYRIPLREQCSKSNRIVRQIQGQIHPYTFKDLTPFTGKARSLLQSKAVNQALKCHTFSLMAAQACFASQTVPMMPERITFPPFSQHFLKRISDGISPGNTPFTFPGGSRRVRMLTHGRKFIIQKTPYCGDSVEQCKKAIAKGLREAALLFSVPTHRNLASAAHIELYEDRVGLYSQCADKEFSKEFRKADRSTAIKYLHQILQGLEVLHTTRFMKQDGKEGVGIVHADIKPTNILLFKDGRVQINDFGESALEGQRRRGYTLAYCAPERLAHPHLPLYRAQDIWAFGITAIAFFTDELPFDKPFRTSGSFQNQDELTKTLESFFHTHHAVVEKKDPEGSIRRMITRCLRVDSAERPTATELLRDPLFEEMAEEPLSPEEDRGGAAGGGGSTAERIAHMVYARAPFQKP